MLARYQEALSSWPDVYRTLPGAWLHRLFHQEAHPALPLVRCLDVVLPEPPSRPAPYAWAESAGLCALTILRLYEENIGDEGAFALARSPYLNRLIELRLSSGVTDRGVLALASSQNLLGVRALGLHRNRVSAEGIASLLSLASLQALHLGRNSLETPSIKVLSQSTLLLQKLDLDYTNLTGEKLRTLCESDCLRGIQELNLSNNPIGREGCEALASCPHLGQLENLFLHSCGLDDDDVEALLSSSHLRALRNLALSQNALTSRSVERLASCGLLSSLTELDICHNPFSLEDAEQKLRASPYLQKVTRLCL